MARVSEGEGYMATETTITTVTKDNHSWLNEWTSETLNLLMDRIEQKGSPVVGMAPVGVALTRFSDEVFKVTISFEKEARDAK